MDRIKACQCVMAGANSPSGLRIRTLSQLKFPRPSLSSSRTVDNCRRQARLFVWSRAGGAPSNLARIENVQKEYALAGTLHLDHLARLKQSPLGEHVLATNASRLERPLRISNSEARSNLDKLLSQHQNEWKSFVNSLGPTSFIRNWTE